MASKLFESHVTTCEKHFSIMGNSSKNDSGVSFEGAVTVGFSDSQVENADIVIGADGLHSCVRKYLDPEGRSEPQFTNPAGVGGEIDRPLLRREGRDLNLPCLILGKDNAFGIMPASYDGNLIIWFYDLPTLPSYYSKSGRIIVIGDAAHVIVPTAGQGAVRSLEDAITLANALAPSLKLNQSAWDSSSLIFSASGRFTVNNVWRR
ncbi:hypothetical protein OIDMADRAFT_56478 [Oidiodendron maius Zn]|uniref:FAD-binding domain-containing protein n=1 Tax=Oidiodendron maius (strain Zn) TaxID=913774 RepID=A0A0C3GTF9_OIDMZ|nr:hypothetical protein OIDMADRAFT_56478 [Oidiodendron maius Zn]